MGSTESSVSSISSTAAAMASANNPSVHVSTGPNGPNANAPYKLDLHNDPNPFYSRKYGHTELGFQASSGVIKPDPTTMANLKSQQQQINSQVDSWNSEHESVVDRAIENFENLIPTPSSILTPVYIIGGIATVIALSSAAKQISRDYYNSR